MKSPPGATSPERSAPGTAGEAAHHPTSPASVILDLPIPPSVNETRKINWAARGKVEDWVRAADARVRLSWNSQRVTFGTVVKRIEGPIEIHILVNGRLDPDNLPKVALDYLRRIEVIENDSPKFVRRLVIEPSSEPAKGECRITVKPFSNPEMT